MIWTVICHKAEINWTSIDLKTSMNKRINIKPYDVIFSLYICFDEYNSQPKLSTGLASLSSSIEEVTRNC